MLLQARSALIETSGDARQGVRRKLLLPVAATRGAHASEAMIHNLSESGLLLETTSDLAIGDRIEVELPDAGAKAAVVMWGSDQLFGCQFVDDLSAGAVSAALLRAPFGTPGADESAELPDMPAPRASEDKLPFPARLYTVLGLAVLSWALMAGLVAWIVGR